MPLTTGSCTGRYEIVPTLGFGGMGEVFRACETKRDHTGAVRIPEAVAGRAAARQKQTTAYGSTTPQRRWPCRMIDALRRSATSAR